MADDANVTEIDLIRTYSSKLSDLKDDSLPVAVLICVQVEKIKEDLQQRLKEAECIKSTAKEKSDHLLWKYNTAIENAGEGARSIVGNSDLEVKMILNNIDIRISEIKDKITRLQTLLDNVFQHTKNYQLQITNMVDSCRDSLNRQIEILEEYKQQQS